MSKKKKHKNFAEPDHKQLRDARDEFYKLIEIKANESCFQELFAECPFILSRSLPLRLIPSDIIPLARPGKSEPDFIFYPQHQFYYPVFGVIELKRPDAPILKIKRKNIILLTEDARVAVSQCVEYSRNLKFELGFNFHNMLLLGNPTYNFVIMGMADDLIKKIKSEIFHRQIEEQLPGECKLIPYDVLLRQYQNTIPSKTFIAIPTMPEAFQQDIELDVEDELIKEFFYPLIRTLLLDKLNIRIIVISNPHIIQGKRTIFWLNENNRINCYIRLNSVDVKANYGYIRDIIAFEIVRLLIYIPNIWRKFKAKVKHPLEYQEDLALEEAHIKDEVSNYFLPKLLEFGEDEFLRRYLLKYV
jgi:hypothetical protein